MTTERTLTLCMEVQLGLLTNNRVYRFSSPRSLTPYMPQFLFHLLPAYLGIAYRGLYSRRSLLGDVSKVISNFFERPTSLSCSMGKIMPQIMEGEMVNQFSLALGSTSLEHPEPVVDPFLVKALYLISKASQVQFAIQSRTSHSAFTACIVQAFLK